MDSETITFLGIIITESIAIVGLIYKILMDKRTDRRRKIEVLIKCNRDQINDLDMIIINAAGILTDSETPISDVDIDNIPIVKEIERRQVLAGPKLKIAIENFLKEPVKEFDYPITKNFSKKANVINVEAGRKVVEEAEIEMKDAYQTIRALNKMLAE